MESDSVFASVYFGEIVVVDSIESFEIDPVVLDSVIDSMGIDWEDLVVVVIVGFDVVIRNDLKEIMKQQLTLHGISLI